MAYRVFINMDFAKEVVKITTFLKDFYFFFVTKSKQKGNLPSKICTVCEKPYNWRKKWAKVWDEVKYCSERCRRNKNKKTNG